MTRLRLPMLLVPLLCAVLPAAYAASPTYRLDPNHTMVLASWDHFGLVPKAADAATMAPSR